MPALYRYSDRLVQFHHSVDQNPRDINFSMHVHEQYEIFCFFSGSASYLVEGNEYALEPGSIVTMRKTESHKIRILGDEPYERLALHFYADVLDGVDPEHLLLESFNNHPLGQNNHYKPSEFSGESPKSILESMCVSDGSDDERRLSVYVHLYPLLYLLRDSYRRKQAAPKARSLAEELVAYINLHLFDDISIASLSRCFFLSPSQLVRIFKNATGSTVWDYIIFKRLSAAQSMIRDGKMPGKAAAECGFHDYSSFYRSYLKRFGVTPKNDMTEHGRNR